MFESWLADNALVLAGFIATGGTALWRIASLEKRMEKQVCENAHEDRRRIYDQAGSAGVGNGFVAGRVASGAASSMETRSDTVRLIEMLLDKLRVNVIIVAGLVTWLILDFGDKLIEKLPAAVGPELLSMLIGVGIGGLIAAMIRMFESPQVPADVHERLVKSLARDDDAR